MRFTDFVPAFFSGWYVAMETRLSRAWTSVRRESRTCSNCGLEYGASSIIFHRKTCRPAGETTRVSAEALSERRKRAVHHKRLTNERETAERRFVASLTAPGPPPEAVSGVRVFGSPCTYCGESFGTYSLPLHMKKCQQRNKELAEKHKYVKERQQNSVNMPSVWRKAEQQNGVHHVHFDPALPQRPRTRSLEHSVLIEKGYSLPSIDHTSGSTMCKTCGELVPREATLLHQQNCRPIPRTVTKGEIVFPALTNTARRSSSSLPDSTPSVRRPPTVVCYICGREYGTRSISIHEPQCLKKFNSENSRLPISKRKPLPKRTLINHVELVVPVKFQEPTTAMLSSQMKTGGVYCEEVLQEAADQYFQYCYREWEKDLVPCKTCGRKFAPERHIKHAHRCKAKPLPKTS